MPHADSFDSRRAGMRCCHWWQAYLANCSTGYCCRMSVRLLLVVLLVEPVVQRVECAPVRPSAV